MMREQLITPEMLFMTRALKENETGSSGKN
jgi:hypothetical protein